MIGAAVLFVLFLAASDSGLGIKPVSGTDWNAFVKDLIDNKVTECKKDSSPRCPVGWVQFDGRCFKYFATLVDFATAENSCLGLGAHVVSLHNENEYQMVKALIRHYDPAENPTWLGLQDCQKKNNWFWSDGTKYSYSKWNVGEPNQANGECCVHLNWNVQKDWNDIPCEWKYAYVCAKRL